MNTVVHNFEASDYTFNLYGSFTALSSGFTELEISDFGKTISKIGKSSPFKLKSVRGVKVSAESEMEHVYGTGALPRAIGVGNVKYSGELKLLKAELLKAVASAQGGFASIFNATFMLFIQADASTSVTKFSNIGEFTATGANEFSAVVSGIRFTELGFDITQGDKFVEIALPFLAYNLRYGEVKN